MGEWDAGDVPHGKLTHRWVLDNTSVQFTFLLTISAVRWPLIEPGAMFHQYRHLIELSRRPNITIQILDSESRPIRDGPLNTFTVFDNRLVAGRGEDAGVHSGPDRSPAVCEKSAQSHVMCASRRLDALLRQRKGLQ